MKSGLLRTFVTGATGGALMIVATAFAADKAQMDKCENMAKQFKAADISGMGEDVQMSAKKKAAEGEALCPSDPEAGIKLLEEAMKEAGLQPGE